MVLDPLFERSELVLENCGSSFLNLSRHALFPLVDLVSLIATFDRGLELENLDVEVDELAESVFESI